MITKNRRCNIIINEKPKTNKYHNTKIIYDGIKFDSKKEANRYKELKLLEKRGIISDLELQSKFLLQPGYVNAKREKIRPIYYVADFYYYDNELKKYVVEDTKGVKTDVYKLKKKMFEYQYRDKTIIEL